MSINAAPPCEPVSVGKRHTLPSPTAEPAAARMMPSLLPKLFLFSIIGCKITNKNPIFVTIRKKNAPPTYLKALGG